MSRQQGRGLGRGLSALLSDIEPEEAEGAAQKGTMMVPIDMIRPNPDQPRRRFDEAQLQELSDSIKERGIIQPLVLRPDPSGEGYQIVAGERRWRAAQRAQVHEAPAVVREMDDQAVLEIAIIENVQRADLSPIEEARGYDRLMEEFGYTQSRVSEIVGKSRSHIANLLRLLNLPDEVMEALESGQISMGHAKALLGSFHPERELRTVLARKLSVRETETLVGNVIKGVMTADGRRVGEATGGRGARRGGAKDADTRALEEDLSANLGMLVGIEDRGGKGDLVVSYRNLDELDRICALLGGGGRE